MTDLTLVKRFIVAQSTKPVHEDTLLAFGMATLIGFGGGYAAGVLDSLVGLAIGAAIAMLGFMAAGTIAPAADEVARTWQEEMA